MIEGSAEILENVPRGSGVFRMSLDFPGLSRAAAPGRFVMVKVAEGLDPLLRRPFSIHDALPDGTVALLYKVVGRGTEILSRKKAGERLSVLGPLGAGFNVEGIAGPVCLVGGGMGVAPLVFLARVLGRMNITGKVLLGGRSACDVFCADVFSGLGFETIISTDDGSLGCCGFVTSPLGDVFNNESGKPAVFACGPHGMLKAVAVLCMENNVPCQVSLESVMACGMGACLGCALPRPGGGNFHVCTDGPVMDAKRLFAA